MAGDRDEGLASFVPARLARQLAADPAQSVGPSADRFDGAVLFADISGFTALAEALGRRGDAGVEDLTRWLNAYFGRLIDVIVAHGGDILKFAGDALIAVWYADEESLADCTCRAVQCGLAAQASLADFSATADVHLSLRIGVSAGPLAILHVGGVNGRRELVATGDPLAGMSAAKADANPGAVAIDADAWASIRERIAAETLPGGAMRVLDVPQPLVPRPLQLTAPADPQALLPYVPPAVADRAGRGEASWLAELRRVTVLFVNFPGLTPATPLERAHAVMLELQACLSRYEGTINKLSLDDKGASLVAAFGLPPLSHDDDPERAVRSALAIRERLVPMRVRHSTGVATGLAFCGIIGNATRREYTMIGDVVNLAARLMQAAGGDILCDMATADASRARVEFEPVRPMPVKGKAGDIPVCHPIASAGPHASARAEIADTTIGRRREQAAIEDALRALSERGEGAILVFEGMAGIGKSRLLDEARRRARRFGLPRLESTGDSMEQTTAFFVCRSLFEQAFGLDPTASSDEREARVKARVTDRGRPEWVALLPLLNPVLRTAFPETGATASIDERARASTTYDLLADLLMALPDSPRQVILLEGAQWMDSASVALAARLYERKVPLVIVAAMRPIPGTAFEEIAALAERLPIARITLERLDDDEIVEVAGRALGAVWVPEQLAAVIRSKADGNPLLSQEIAAAVRDAGLIAKSGGECRLVPGADLRSLDLPTSIQGAVTARLDRLSPFRRLLLKVASVVGRTFEEDVVAQLVRREADEALVADNFGAIEAMGLIALVRSDPAPAYAFQHAAFHEVTYRQMLFAQRRELHRAVAELLERRHADALADVYSRLAFHWTKAVESDVADDVGIGKAIEYLHRAGEQSLRQLAAQEAVEFLSHALRLLERLPASVERSRRELALCCLIGAPLLVTKGFAAPETEHAYSRASDLCQQIENSPEQFNAVYGLWGFALMKTDLGRARALAGEVFRMAQSAGDPELLLPANRAVGDTAFWLGDLVVARTHLEQAVSLYRPEHHAPEVFRSGQDQGVVASALSAWVVWLLGYPDAALARMEDTLALARRLSHGHTMAMTFQNYTMIHQFRGEVDPILEKTGAQLALSQSQGFPLWQAGATLMRGWARAQRGEPAEGIADMRRGIEAWRATGAELAAPYYLGLLAETLGACGRPEEGIDVMLEAIASSDRSGEAWWRAELLRIDAELGLQLAAPEVEVAERRLLDALDLARSQQARSLELRAAASLCRLWTRRGRPPLEAERPLIGVFEWFTEGHATADLLQAARLLSSTRAAG
jgi:class 3 adenylate cyclase/predicted ATPase